MDSLKSTLASVYETVVLGNQKAIVSWVTSFIGSLSIQVQGINIVDATVEQVIGAVVISALTSAGVWLQANKK